MVYLYLGSNDRRRQRGSLLDHCRSGFIAGSFNTQNVHKSFENHQSSFLGTLLAPALPMPQPTQGEFPTFPLASQSINLESLRVIFFITDFSVALIRLCFSTSIPK
jgi:hypothetical protein